MADETLSERLARHYASLRLQQIPEGVVRAAKLHILDTLGCLLAGSRLEPGKRAYDLAAAGRGNEATLFGSATRASYLDAAQAMAVAVHCGEMDDIHSGAGTCIGAMIVPALLALAQKNGGSGARFLEAVVAGYETTVRVGLAVDAPALFARGWWPSTVCGAFGVGLAAVKFLELAADKAANTLGIASLYAGGMITGGAEGATARHLIFGHAARNGLLALSAGEAGFTGPRKAFEDQRGFCLTLTASPKWEYLQKFDSYFLPEVAFKPYPCARQLHAGVEALLKILRQHALTNDRIGEIELFLPAQNVAMMNRPTITPTHAATVGSGQYVMAVTALRGKMDLASFEEKFLRSEDVRRLMNRVKVSASPELDRHYPKYWPGRVTVRFADGQSYAEEVVIPKGERGNPMTASEVEEKFLSLAAPVIGDDKARSAMEAVYSLESSDSLAPLLGMLK